MTLLNIAYAPKCDSNSISLGKLHKSRILYYNHPNFMISRKESSTLRVTNRHKNIFFLETSFKIMLVKTRGRPRYFFSSNLQIWLWHYYLGYPSNARIIYASKFVNSIDLRREVNFDDRFLSFNY